MSETDELNANDSMTDLFRSWNNWRFGRSTIAGVFLSFTQQLNKQEIKIESVWQWLCLLCSDLKATVDCHSVSEHTRGRGIPKQIDVFEWICWKFTYDLLLELKNCNRLCNRHHRLWWRMLTVISIVTLAKILYFHFYFTKCMYIYNTILN